MSEQHRQDVTSSIDGLQTFPCPEPRRPVGAAAIAAIAARIRPLAARVRSARSRAGTPAQPTRVEPAEAARLRDARAEERRRAIDALLFGRYWPH
jgi:hypothetical protein